MISQSGSTGDAGDQYTGLDRFGRVVDQRWITGTGSSASDVDRYGYTYDRNSNRTERANAMNSAYSESYTYDDLNQLQIFARSGGTPTTQGWMMDALGNWTFRVTDSLPEFGTTNAQNELTDIDSATLAYDANGNMTVDELGRSLTYDAWNRLTVVVDAYSIPVAAYQYDALGQRVLCYTDDGTVAELRDLFYSDQWQVLEERVRPTTGGVSSQAALQNVWSPVYVDALIERDRDADASATTGVGGLEERVYALQDANWNTTAIVAASVTGVTAGTVLNRFIYSAYGEAEVFDAAWSSVSAPSVPWTQLFQGLSMTGLTGLAYVRHRDYSPRLGRFIQRDPLGFEAGDTNWYRFVGNAPTGKLDPTGEIVWVPVIIGIGLGYWWTTNPANAPGPNDPVYPPDETGFVQGVVVGAGLGWRPGSAGAGRCPAPIGGLAGKTLPELKGLTNGLPWSKLWEEGAEGVTKALARLRAGEKVLPDGMSREALEAYAEIARRALANPAKATEVQRLRLQYIEELLKGMGG